MPWLRVRACCSHPSIVKHDVEDQNQTASRSKQEEYYREPRVSEERECCRDIHEKRGTDYQCSEHEPDGYSVGNLLKSFDERILVDRFDIDAKLIVRNLVENTIDASR